MKAGVCSVPRGSVSSPRRASPSVAWTSNFIVSPSSQARSSAMARDPISPPMRREGLVEIRQRLDTLLVFGQRRRHELVQLRLGLSERDAGAIAEIWVEDEVG